MWKRFQEVKEVEYYPGSHIFTIFGLLLSLPCQTGRNQGDEPSSSKFVPVEALSAGARVKIVDEKL